MFVKYLHDYLLSISCLCIDHLQFIDKKKFYFAIYKRGSHWQEKVLTVPLRIWRFSSIKVVDF